MYKALDKWLVPHLRRTRPAPRHGLTEIMLCICDHFEPFHATSPEHALERVEEWRTRHPNAVAAFHDADGRHPSHTVFYPIEQYDEAIVERLAEWTRTGSAEVEIHLHHEADTEAGLRERIEIAKSRFRRHGLLCSDAEGRVRYGFIHGNWALDNSHPAGRFCGINRELAILSETGCYADFTLPSAPEPTQTRIINSLYYAHDTPQPKSHDSGRPVCVRNTKSELGLTPIAPCLSASANPASSPPLLLVQGPLGLNWHNRKLWILPRIENSDLAGNNPPTLDRFRIWLDMNIHVQGRPEWIFIKLHTHGCNEKRNNLSMLLGKPMQDFHAGISKEYNDGQRFRLHYVSARELVNIIHAAEDGFAGNPGDYRDYRYGRPGKAGQVKG